MNQNNITPAPNAEIEEIKTRANAKIAGWRDDYKMRAEMGAEMHAQTWAQRFDVTSAALEATSMDCDELRAERDAERARADAAERAYADLAGDTPIRFPQSESVIVRAKVVSHEAPPFVFCDDLGESAAQNVENDGNARGEMLEQITDERDVLHNKNLALERRVAELEAAARVAVDRLKRCQLYGSADSTREAFDHLERLLPAAPADEATS